MGPVGAGVAEGVGGVAATLPAAALRFSCARLSSRSSAVGCSVAGAGGVGGVAGGVGGVVGGVTGFGVSTGAEGVGLEVGVGA